MTEKNISKTYIHSHIQTQTAAYKYYSKIGKKISLKRNFQRQQQNITPQFLFTEIYRTKKILFGLAFRLRKDQLRGRGESGFMGGFVIGLLLRVFYKVFLFFCCCCLLFVCLCCNNVLLPHDQRTNDERKKKHVSFTYGWQNILRNTQ